MDVSLWRREEAMTDCKQDGDASTAAAGLIQWVAEGAAAARTVVAEKAEKGDALIRSGAAGTAASFAAASEALVGYAKNLDWSLIDHSKWLQVGTHGVGRSLEEAKLVWESIPEQLRALGPEVIAKRLEGFDWSHIVPYSKGGGNDAANGIFELTDLNRARGAEQMTGAEIEAAAQVLSQTAFEAALQEIASQALAGATMSAAVSCVLSSLKFGLEYQRGNIDRDTMYRSIGLETGKSAVVGAAILGIVSALALKFPAIIPLALPLILLLAAVGFCIVGHKLVGLGRGWYELYRESPATGFPLRFA